MIDRLSDRTVILLTILTWAAVVVVVAHLPGDPTLLEMIERNMGGAAHAAGICRP